MALDDFGVGYSSIGYLRSFAFDKLKLDRSLIASIDRDPRAQKLVQATMALADALELSVTAEGVETEEEATILKDCRLRRISGLFLRPSGTGRRNDGTARRRNAAARDRAPAAPRLSRPCRATAWALPPLPASCRTTINGPAGAHRRARPGP